MIQRNTANSTRSANIARNLVGAIIASSIIAGSFFAVANPASARDSGQYYNPPGSSM